MAQHTHTNRHLLSSKIHSHFQMAKQNQTHQDDVLFRLLTIQIRNTNALTQTPDTIYTANGRAYASKLSNQKNNKIETRKCVYECVCVFGG